MKKFVLIALLLSLVLSIGCCRCRPRYPKQTCVDGKCELVTCACGCMEGKKCTCPKCPLD